MNLRIVIPLGTYLCEIVLLYFRRVMLFSRSGSHNYSAIHVQVNSIPKGVTTHVQNKRSDFNRGYFFLGHPVYYTYSNKNSLLHVVLLNVGRTACSFLLSQLCLSCNSLITV